MADPCRLTSTKNAVRDYVEKAQKGGSEKTSQSGGENVSQDRHEVPTEDRGYDAFHGNSEEVSRDGGE